MGRFSDLWASGRFVTKAKPEQASAAQPAVDTSQMQDIASNPAIPENSRQILAALSARRGQETGRWLNSLAAEGKSKAPAQTAARPGGASAFDDVVALSDQLFKEFAELSFEFNKSAVGTELMVSIEMPEKHEKKSDEVWYRPVEKTYEGRLTTRQWALVLKGDDKKLAVYLVPSSMLLALSFGEQQLTAPFMEIAHAGGGQWTIGGESTSMVAVSPLAKELLGDLVRVSSGVMSENEVFSSKGDGAVTLGENLAVGFQNQAPAATPHTKKPGIEDLDMHDACDVVDRIIDEELQRLYAKAKSLQPGSPNTDALRKQISAVENFRVKMIDAFEEYTHITLMLEGSVDQQTAAKV